MDPRRYPYIPIPPHHPQESHVLQDKSQNYDHRGDFPKPRYPSCQVDGNSAFQSEAAHAPNMDRQYPYQYGGHPQPTRTYNEETKHRQGIPGHQAHHTTSTPKPRQQHYSQMTAVQQRQEYYQRLAQHQQMLRQREYAIAAERAQQQAKQLQQHRVAPESAPTQSARPHSIAGHTEHYNAVTQRPSAFSATSPTGPSSHLQGRQGSVSIDSLLQRGFAQHQQQQTHKSQTQQHQPRESNQTHALRHYDPPQVEHYARSYNPAKNLSDRDAKETIARKLKEGYALKHWEALSQDQKLGQYSSRETPTANSASVANTAVPSQTAASREVPADQLDAELAHLKDVVRHMEILREQRDKYQKHGSASFQYLEKVGNQHINSAPVASVQPTQNPVGSSRSDFTSPYHHPMAPPTGQQRTSPPKYNEITSPQKSPSGPAPTPNQYLAAMERQHITSYQQQQQKKQQHQQQQQQQHNPTHSPPHRTPYQRQPNPHHQNPPIHKKELHPSIPLVAPPQGLPKIVDVRSLANVAVAAAMHENAMSPLSRSKRRGSEASLVGEGRLVRMRSNSSPESYAYEMTEPRSADSCDSGVESLASPDAAHISGHLYNRNAFILAQQHQLELAKAQHAASFDAMKRQQKQHQHQQQQQLHHHQQQQQQQHVSRHDRSYPNKGVRLERAGSPLKLSELIEKDQVCPTPYKELDSLTCKCRACMNHQEKTVIELRDLWRERRIKKYPPSFQPSKSHSISSSETLSSHQHKEVIVISDNDDGVDEIPKQRIEVNASPVDRKRESSSIAEELLQHAKKMRMSQPTDFQCNNEVLDLRKKTVVEPEQCNPPSCSPALSATMSSATMSSATMPSAAKSSSKMSSDLMSSVPKTPTPMSSTPMSSIPMSSTPMSAASISFAAMSSDAMLSAPKLSAAMSSTTTSSASMASTQASSSPVSSGVQHNDSEMNLRQNSHDDGHRKNPVMPRGLTIEQVITSCIGHEVLHQKYQSSHDGGKSTSVEQMITNCIDQSLDKKVKELKAENEKSAEDQSPMNSCHNQNTPDLKHAVIDGSNQHNNNIDEEPILKNSFCEADYEEFNSEPDQSKSSTKSKRGDALYDIPSNHRQVFLTGVKVVVEKLKVHNDMVLPCCDDTVPEHNLMNPRRPASVPAYDLDTLEDLSVERRAQSVGLSNSLSHSESSLHRRPPPLIKKSADSDKQQDLRDEKERRLTPPSITCDKVPVSEECGSIEQKRQIYREVHHFATLFQNERTSLQHEGFKKKNAKCIPTNLRDCWGDTPPSSGGEVKLTKDMGPPKVQWKALWAKEKKSDVVLPEKSSCRVCSVENMHVCNCRTRSDQENVEDLHNSKRQKLDETQRSCVGQGKDEVQQPRPKSVDEIPEEKNVSKKTEEEITSAEADDEAINLATNSQPKSCENTMPNSAPTKSSQGATILDNMEKRTRNTFPIETYGHLLSQSTSMPVVKVKQHGKATIFHKNSHSAEPHAEPTLQQQQQQPVNLQRQTSDATAAVAELKSQKTISHVSSNKQGRYKSTEREKHEDKQFPRLSFSPTAMLDSFSADPQEEPMSLISDANQNIISDHPPPNIPAHAKNVLRVMPKFRHPTPVHSVSAQPVPVATTHHNLVQTSIVEPVSFTKPKVQTLKANPIVEKSMSKPLVQTAMAQPVIVPTSMAMSPKPMTTSMGSPEVQTAISQLVVHTSKVQPMPVLSMDINKDVSLLVHSAKTTDVQSPLQEPESVEPSNVCSVIKRSIEETLTEKSGDQEPMGVPDVQRQNSTTHETEVHPSVVESDMQQTIKQKSNAQPDGKDGAHLEEHLVIKSLESTTQQDNKTLVVQDVTNTLMHHPTGHSAQVCTSVVQPMVQSSSTTVQSSMPPQSSIVQSGALQVHSTSQLQSIVQTSPPELYQMVYDVSARQPVKDTSVGQNELQIPPTVVDKTSTTVQHSERQLTVQYDDQSMSSSVETDRLLETASKEDHMVPESTCQLPANQSHPDESVSSRKPLEQLSHPTGSPRSPARSPTGGTLVIETSAQPTPLPVSTMESLTEISTGQQMVQTPPGTSALQTSITELLLGNETSNGKPVVHTPVGRPLVHITVGQPTLQTSSNQPMVMISSGQSLTQTSTSHHPVHTSSQYHVHVSEQSQVHNTSGQSLHHPGHVPMKVTMAAAPVANKLHPGVPTSLPVTVQTSQAPQTIPRLIPDEEQLNLSALANVNRRLKSNSPHIQVSTGTGYSRYQKDNYKMREIYRVEMFDEPQPLDLKTVSKKKQTTVSAYKVAYMQRYFPCVIRSEVPFVPPQMLQEAFFTSLDYADFNFALQKCSILHRYMTMHEQGAMSRACVTRTWNGSCKLIALDEFDAKFDQITELLEKSKEDQ